jgi:hypothetical protein
VAEFTLTIPDKLAESLKGLEQPLKADIIVVHEALKWNIHECAGSISGEVEREAPRYLKIRESAEQVQALAAACDEVERGELPAIYHLAEAR